MAEEIIVKSKEHIYRGVNVEELRKLDVREFAKYLPSRNRRTVLRNFDSIEKFVKRCEIKMARNKKIKTHDRDMVIVPKMIGMSIQVHNGKTFNDIRILPQMLGHRLGEFSLSRQKVSHGDPGIGATKSSSGDKK
ncbi:MAG: 30S ribosomal protein S19 [Nanoarchaeota archaeon]|nr:30S ribosomal protein S19 [Nanoarchaeota archaeon]